MKWIASAACRGRTELFFAPSGERPPARDRRVAEALALCGVCPVVADCARYGAEASEGHGIYGGVVVG
jgi:WhiB family redox-sensing transcriptional regulator